MAQSIEQLSYESTTGELERQLGSVESLRTRSSALIGAAGVTEGLFAGIRHSSVNVRLVGGLVMLVLCITACVLVVIPRAQLITGIDGQALLELAEAQAGDDPEEHVDVRDAYRTALASTARAVTANQAVISVLSNTFSAACIFFLIEIGFGAALVS